MRAAVLALGALVLLSPAAASQETDQICGAVEKVQVGQWAEYMIQIPALTEGPVSRFSIVGAEDFEGREHFWFEMLTRPAGAPFVLQFLIPGFPYEATDVQGMVMAMGEGEPMEMPREMVESLQRQQGDNLSLPMLEACKRSEVVDWREAEVPAGTFRALTVEARVGGGPAEVWLSAEVPFGLVKYVMPDGTEMVLTAFGDDAESFVKR